MKHLFYVHSHITFLVSKQYVFDQGINPDDCLFLCARNYKIINEYQQLFKNIREYPQDVFGNDKEGHSILKNLCNGFHDIYAVENFINSFCKGDVFILYTLSTHSHFCSIIVTMNQCYGYYIIEEGSSSYADLKLIPNYIGSKIPLYQSVMACIFPRFYILKDSYHSTAYKKYKGTITTSDQALSKLKGEHIIVSNPFGKKSLTYSPTAILSVDATLYIYNIKLESIETLMEYLRQFILKSNENPIIAYKMHPVIKNDYANTVRNVILKVFNGLQIEELPSDVAIEEVLNEYHCAFFSDWSSVAIYASQMGCKCYSYTQKLVEISNNSIYALRAKEIYDILRDVYVPLN